MRNPLLTPEQQQAADAFNRLDKRLEQMHWKHPIHFTLLAAGIGFVLFALMVGIEKLFEP